VEDLPLEEVEVVVASLLVQAKEELHLEVLKTLILASFLEEVECLRLSHQVGVEEEVHLPFLQEEEESKRHLQEGEVHSS
jgi:hypothetical protein